MLQIDPFYLQSTLTHIIALDPSKLSLATEHDIRIYAFPEYLALWVRLERLLSVA